MSEAGGGSKFRCDACGVSFSNHAGLVNHNVEIPARQSAPS